MAKKKRKIIASVDQEALDNLAAANQITIGEGGRIYGIADFIARAAKRFGAKP
jgi:hypothetical protein